MNIFQIVEIVQSLTIHPWIGFFVVFVSPFLWLCIAQFLAMNSTNLNPMYRERTDLIFEKVRWRYYLPVVPLAMIALMFRGNGTESIRLFCNLISLAVTAFFTVQLGMQLTAASKLTRYGYRYKTR